VMSWPLRLGQAPAARALFLGPGAGLRNEARLFLDYILPGKLKA